MGPLLERAPARITIANRTPEKALALRDMFDALGEVAACPLGAIDREHDIVINATSAGTRGEAIAYPRGILRAGVFAYDMAYGPGARPFIEAARAGGAEARDGLGMLVEQAAEAFFQWRGIRPETGPVLAGLRARLA
jgi:shikimate dehydrogenase